MEQFEDKAPIERMGYATKVDLYISDFNEKDPEKVRETLRILEERVKLPDMQGDSKEVMDARFTFDAQIEAARFVLDHVKKAA
jgi:hypothetical protein